MILAIYSAMGYLKIDRNAMKFITLKDLLEFSKKATASTEKISDRMI